MNLEFSHFTNQSFRKPGPEWWAEKVQEASTETEEHMALMQVYMIMSASIS